MQDGRREPTKYESAASGTSSLEGELTPPQAKSCKYLIQKNTGAVGQERRLIVKEDP